MAITLLKETFGRRFESNIVGEETAIRQYFAYGNTDYDDLDDVVTDAITAGLPDLGDTYSASSSSLVVTNHVPREIERELRFYKIEVQYQTDNLLFNFPTSQPWVIEFSSIPQEYVPEKTLFDTTGVVGAKTSAVTANQPILNAAGFPFDPPVTDFKTLLGIRLTKNFSNISDIGSITNIADLMGRVNTVNDNTTVNPVVIAGISGTKYQFWLENINATNEEQNGEDFYRVSFDIVYDPEGHWQKILNAGWVDNNGDAIKGDKGGPISNPWPLAGSGAPIPGRPLRGGAAARALFANYYGFGMKSESDFSDLGLPTTF